MPCDQCKGKRYNRETLEVKYKGKSIHEVLEMTIEEAREFFDAVPALARKLQTLMDVGLSYIRLGQSATTLSGGEAQRVKLARELSKRAPARRCISSTNRPPVCTSPIFNSCWRYCISCAIRATPSWSSSITGRDQDRRLDRRSGAGRRQRRRRDPGRRHAGNRGRV